MRHSFLWARTYTRTLRRCILTTVVLSQGLAAVVAVDHDGNARANQQKVVGDQSTETPIKVQTDVIAGAQDYGVPGRELLVVGEALLTK